MGRIEKLDNEGSLVRITGSSGVAVAWMLHHYLKYYCNSHISWQTQQISLPTKLPTINLTLPAVDLFRYSCELVNYAAD